MAASNEGYVHSCALRLDGTVQCWGSNDDGQLGDLTTMTSTVPVNAVGVTRSWTVATAGVHSCATLTDGTAWCWGSKGDGRLLGEGALLGSQVPLRVPGLDDVAAVSARGGTYALRSDGTTHRWGPGVGTVPLVISVLPDALAISGLCALLLDGTVSCLGADGVPVTIAGVTGAATLADTCAVLDGGAVQCWDGMGVVTGILGLENAVAVSGTCAVMADGTVWCWGPDQVPAPVEGLTDASSISLSSVGHACVVRLDGTAACWGKDGWGQLGDGSDWQPSSIPVPVVGLTDVVAISAGGAFIGGGCGHDDCYRGRSCAVVAEGSAYCWGVNDEGAPGSDEVWSSNVPVAVTGLTGAVDVSVGTHHVCARLDDGTLWCWGSNWEGQLGDGGPFPHPGVPIQVAAW